MATLTERIETLEKQNVAYSLLLEALHQKDTETAHALDVLTTVINDPKTGLVVVLDRFEEKARQDRRVQLAFFAGLVVIVNIAVPFIPVVLKALFP